MFMTSLYGSRTKCLCAMKHYGSLVPRPSASHARIAFVTFEPLSDSWQKAWYHSYVIYIKWTRFGTRFHIKWRRTRSSRANGRFPSELLIPRRPQLDANSALTGIQHALTFNYSDQVFQALGSKVRWGYSDGGVIPIVGCLCYQTKFGNSAVVPQGRLSISLPCSATEELPNFVW